MATGRKVCPSDYSLVQYRNEDVEFVRDFHYLASTVEANGRALLDVAHRIAKASRIFAVFYGQLKEGARYREVK